MGMADQRPLKLTFSAFWPPLTSAGALRMGMADQRPLKPITITSPATTASIAWVADGYGRSEAIETTTFPVRPSSATNAGCGWVWPIRGH